MRSLARACLLGAAWATGSPGDARADRIDPTAPPRLVAGSPGGHAPMHRLGTARLGQSPVQLPREPRLDWKLRLEGEPVGAPAIDAVGRMVVATTDRRLTQMDPRGKVEWQLDLPAAPSSGVVLTSDGLRAAATEDGTVLTVTPRGQIVRRAELGPTGPLRAPPLPTDHGGLLVAVGVDLHELGPLGALRARVTAPARIAALTQRDGVTVVATETGAVLTLHPSGQLRLAGSLGGRLSGAFLQTGPHTVFGVVQGTTLVELDLARGTRRALPSIAADTFVDLVAAATTTGPVLRSATRSGQLLQHEASGAVPLGGPLPLTPGRPLEADSQLLVVDPSGSVALLGRDAVAVVTSSGDSRVLPLGGCDAVCLAPAGPGRLVVACRGGLVLGVGEAEPKASGTP